MMNDNVIGWAPASKPAPRADELDKTSYLREIANR